MLLCLLRPYAGDCGWMSSGCNKAEKEEGEDKRRGRTRERIGKAGNGSRGKGVDGGEGKEGGSEGGRGRGKGRDSEGE